MNEKNLTPKEIVAELDRFIIGQDQAKRCVAIALRNRWRRRQVAEDLRDEIVPKNIIMMGPTGVGKTEIARRLARLADAPFIKVEATKFTEVGYVGKDVESMIRELTETAIKMVREEEKINVQIKAKEQAEERLLDLLLPGVSKKTDIVEDIEEEELNSEVATSSEAPFDFIPDLSVLSQPIDDSKNKQEREKQELEEKNTREKFRKMLHGGELNERIVEVPTQQRQSLPSIEVVAAGSLEEMNSNLRDMFSNVFQPAPKKRKMKVPDALEALTQEEASRLIDMESVTKLAIERVEQNGIIFIDEIDKIARSSGSGSGHGPDVSREGVQRDILPIIEGSSVTTKHGIVRTDHILFVAAGAFHSTKPSDLIPELQGRFPIRVELKSLTKDDFVRILNEPENSLVKQYRAMMQTEGIELNFTSDSIEEICEVAAEVNSQIEDIGARRLHTIMEKLLEQISFDAPLLKGEKINIDREYVSKQLAEIVKNRDLRRYIL